MLIPYRQSIYVFHGSFNICRDFPFGFVHVWYVSLHSAVIASNKSPRPTPYTSMSGRAFKSEAIDSRSKSSDTNGCR